MRALAIVLMIMSACWQMFAYQTEAIDSLAVSQSVEVVDTVAEITHPIDSVSDKAANQSAPRKITPVDVDDNKPFKPSLHYYDKKGELLDEPVLFLSELDTIKSDNKPKMTYKALNSMSIGLNVWDPIMAIAGQKYGGIDVWADLSIHNRFFPVVELGVGIANSTPKEGNYTYKGKPSVYVKVGMNYNFFFNDTDDYQLFAGIRGGFSSFNYDIDNITINSSYWDESHNFSITDQHSTALYGEALLGIKVRIYKAFSMGWTVRYHHLFKCNDAKNSTPFYIPGFGNRNGKLGASFSLIYTLPLSRKVPRN